MKAPAIVLLWLRQGLFGFAPHARPYPSLTRQHRRLVRRLFLYGLLFPDAMHHAIWGDGDNPDPTMSETLSPAEQARRN